jgi:2-polyprenyl-6-methoxyphenol hydroxylase-like FAD-dependent oxidoreductase
VVVVGGGLGGLAAGVAAHRAGHAVVVLERSAELRETGTGIGVMPNGVRALDALGLGRPVRERAIPLPAGGGLRDRHGRPLLAVDQAAISARARAPLVVVDRAWLHRLLDAALPDGAVRTGVPVDAVHDGDERARLVLGGPRWAGGGRGTPGPERTGRDGGRNHAHAPFAAAPGCLLTKLTADLLVVADGAASRLRTTLFPDRPGLAGSGEYAARALARPGLDVAPVSGELLDYRTGDRFGMMPLADGRTYWYTTWAATRAVPSGPAARLGALRARYADWHPAVGALLAATDPAAVHVSETAQLVRGWSGTGSRCSATRRTP